MNGRHENFGELTAILYVTFKLLKKKARSESGPVISNLDQIRKERRT
jgi:hypothetical protein